MIIGKYARSILLAQTINQLNELRLYTGAMPTDPDSSPTGTLLVKFGGLGAIYGTGMDWTDSITVPDGSAKFASITSELAVASGVVGYAMLLTTPPDLIQPPTNWIYLTVGTSGAELNFSHTTIKQDSNVTLIAGSFSSAA